MKIIILKDVDMKIKLFVALLVVIASLQAAAPKKQAGQSNLGWYPKFQALELESKIMDANKEFQVSIGDWHHKDDRIATTEEMYPFLLQKYPQANGSHVQLMKILTDLAAKRKKEQEDEEEKAATLAKSKKGMNPKAKAFQPKGSAKIKN